MVTFLDSGSAKPLKTNGAFKSDFSAQPTRTHRSAEASIGERTTDATPRHASKPPP